MEFALVNNVRTSATPSARATCPQCSNEVLAKCGQINVHHWAHVVGEDCDPWSEPETPWHRYWKSFGHATEQTIGNHRADIITSSGLTVELQHSSISVEEIRVREAFYGSRLRWLFDGTDLIVKNADGGWHYVGSEEDNTHFHKEYCEDEEGNTVWYEESDLDEDEEGNVIYQRPAFALHLRWREQAKHLVTFRWKHPRKSYGACRAPVYVDLRGPSILKLGKLYLESGPPYGGWGTLVPRATVEGWLR